MLDGRGRAARGRLRLVSDSDSKHPQPAAAGAGSREERDRYLKLQIERQQRGEPVDFAWVRAELERTERRSRERLQASTRRMRFTIFFCAGVFVLLWLVRAAQAGNVMGALLPALVVCLLGVWALRRSR